MSKRRRKSPPERGRMARIAAALIARPATTGGSALMLAMAAAIVTNALALQPGPHPAPLFLDTRPGPPEEIVARPSAPALGAERPGSIEDLVARTTGRVDPSVDSGLVAEIQDELKQRGYYEGEVDGITGPMTSAAIVRFEEAEGLSVTGEPTGDVLAALRAGRDSRRSEAEPPVPPAPPVAPRARPMVASGEETAAIEARPARLDASAAMPRAEPAVSRVAAAPAPDARLAKVQESLDLLGYGPLRPDGLWNAETRAAIRRFEENRGLPLTGEVNQAFVTELVRIGGLSLD